MSKDTGGSAFPSVMDTYDETQGAERGMSLRDWFATHATEEDIKALRNLVPKVVEIRDNYGPGPAFIEHRAEPKNWRQVARYLHADMMLKARRA